MQDFVARITTAATPGTFLVDFFPIMKYLPSWMARWKRDGLAWHEEQSKIFEEMCRGAAAKKVNKLLYIRNTEALYLSL